MEDFDQSTRPDLFEMRDGNFYTRDGMEHAANLWAQRRNRAAKKASRAIQRAAAGSPTAVFRTLEIGQQHAFKQYRNRTQLAPIAARMADILERTFEIHVAHGAAVLDAAGAIRTEKWLVVTRTA